MTTRQTPRQTRRRQPRGEATAPPRYRPRTHAFTGCLTCRERHVKCDLGQPGCSNCLRLKLVCEGYTRKYSWMSPITLGQGTRISISSSGTENEENQSSRRVLFSDDERQAMVAQMREECSFNSCLDLDRVLRDLQERTSDDFRKIGPFGVLSMRTESTAEEGEVTLLPVVEDLAPLPTPELDMSPPDFVWGDVGCLVDIPENTTVGDLDWGSRLMEQILDEASLTHPNPATILPASSNNRPFHIHESGSELVLASSIQLERNSLPSAEPSTSALTISDSWNISPSILTMSNDENLAKLPPEARSLLNYYSVRVIDVMSMSPTEKAPWRTIHLPCAMSALADVVVYGETKSFAKMALLYALLSVSSFHIALAEKSSDERSNYWNARGALHKSKAVRYLQSALDTTLPKVTRGKYKEVLMTILSMVTIGVFSGDMRDAHGYLAKSEDFIRTYGLPKRIKSPKVSKLHHIFSYLRIVQESTSVIWMDAPDEAGHPLSNSQDDLHYSNSQMWVEDEEPEVAEEDSLFVSIYQLPITLLSLISQTSSLCKQLQSGESSSPEFARHCQAVEDRIFRWRPPQISSVGDTWEYSSSPSKHIVAATYEALIIHFQRQIRNTDPQCLQHYVLSAADHLLAHEKQNSTLNMAIAPFPWPSFIVGCEAYDSNARERINTYMETIRSYNIGNLVQSEKVIREVWRRQDLGQSDHRWEDVLRDWKMRIVLT